MKTSSHAYVLLAALVTVGSICLLPAAPNLVPYQPTGWSDEIVVSTAPGTTTNNAVFTTADTLYVDWAVLNNGDTATASSFYSGLYVDGVLKNYWLVPSPLNPGYYYPVTDYFIGMLSAGTHTITITNDSFSLIPESDESDNAYSTTITVSPPSRPNLTPHQPAEWSDAIIASSVTGTTTNSEFLTTLDTVYIDWAVLNNGTAPTGARFYTKLFVDGMERASWYTEPPLATNSHAWVLDYSLGQMSYGAHTLTVMTDTTAAITESDEGDNTYYRQIVIGHPPQPNLAPATPPGWSDKIVVSTNSSSTTDTPSPTTADTLFVSWAVANIGNGPVTNTLLTTLTVDGVLMGTWTNLPPIPPSERFTNIGLPIGKLSVNLHTITVATDTSSSVSESNEGDNSFTKLVAILQAPPTLQTLPPTAVTDVAAQLNASIVPHGGAGYFWFEYGPTTSYGSATPLESFTANATNLVRTISGLTPETPYHYRAVAYNGGGTNQGGDVAFSTGGPDIRIVPLSLSFTGGVYSSVPPARAPMPWQGPGGGSASLASAVPKDKLLHAQDLLGGFGTSATVRVTVNLAADGLAHARRPGPRSTLERRAGIREAQQRVLSALPSNDAKLRFRFENIPAFSAEVTPAGLRALQNNPDVISLEPVYILRPHLAQGIPLIHAAAHRSAYNGAGMAIAICDTGVDYNHPRLGGGGFPNAKVLGGYDFGDNDADPKSDGEGHGTCCAGIAAGDLGTVGDYIGGVAYNAKLYALKISEGAEASATTDAETAAVDWCYTHQRDNTNYPIMVISMSFGGGRFYEPCGDALPSMTAAVSNALSAGITVLMSSGNDGYCDSIAFPSCVPGVISVGAVYDAAFGHASPCVSAASCAPKSSTSGCSSGYYVDDVSAPDKVTAYSNMAEFMTLMGPGNEAYTTDVLGSAGYASGDYDPTFGGTSAACPYAAGAVACLQSAAKARTGSYLSPEEVKTRLLLSGDNVTDTKVAITKPRVNLERAIDNLDNVSQSFRIHNDGAGMLTVTSIASDIPAPWIVFTPSGSFQIPAGECQDVSVVVLMGQAPAGHSTARLLVHSTDADKSPYPEGVYVNAFNQQPLLLTAIGVTNEVVYFKIEGPVGTVCVAQVSTNLIDWQPLCTNEIPTSASLGVSDSGATNDTRRFYRAVMP